MLRPCASWTLTKLSSYPELRMMLKQKSVGEYVVVDMVLVIVVVCVTVDVMVVVVVAVVAVDVLVTTSASVVVGASELVDVEAWVVVVLDVAAAAAGARVALGAARCGAKLVCWTRMWALCC
mmetsp:Transcript_3806/g.12124  ORF Transcript_3806/g.12124 Transcript_3806/m.12124 type:complete len:122 (-) Transcript_3806:407-772(-)